MPTLPMFQRFPVDGASTSFRRGTAPVVVTLAGERAAAILAVAAAQLAAHPSPAAAVAAVELERAAIAALDGAQAAAIVARLARAWRIACADME